MSHIELNEVEIQNLLDALTDRICVEQGDVQPVLRRYGVGTESRQISEFTGLIYRLSKLLRSEAPSTRFVNNLKTELIGEEERAFASLRRFPMRAQMAAGIAAVAAGVLFVSRRREEKEVKAMGESLEAALQ